MNNNKKKDYRANLAFLLNYGNGQKPEEIESDVMRLALQRPESRPYDRAKGAGFQLLEQDDGNLANYIQFVSRLVESVYLYNISRNSDPYYLVSYNTIDATEGQIEVTAYLQEDLNTKGVSRL